MNSLLDLQNKFQNYLLFASYQIEESIVTTNTVPAEIRLAIYSNAYYSRLVEALAANFPVLQAYLGEKAFSHLGYEYIDKHPSMQRSIRWFGKELSDFLKEHINYGQYPYLSELAQFEWAMSLVFDAADSEILQIHTMSSLPADQWETTSFQVHPSMQRLDLSWNIPDIWQAVSCDNDPPQPAKKLAPVSWILWRKGLINQFCSLPEDEVFAIDAMIKGSSFGEICEGLCRWSDEEQAGTRAGSLLKGWIEAELISQLII